MTLKLFHLLTLCGGCSHAHDIGAEQKHESQGQHIVSGQGLDLHLKTFQSDFAKKRNESFIIITCVSLTAVADIGKDCHTLF